MKMIFWTLLLLNTGYFGYHYLGYEGQSNAELKPGDRVKQVPGESVKTIYLLNEKSSPEMREQELDFIIKNPHLSRRDAETELCIGVGPFSDLFAGQAAVEQLIAINLEVQLMAVDQLVGRSDYRLMIPPARTLQDAFRKLRELKSQNINSYVMTRGRDALGISLGVFSNDALATIAKEKLELDGYDSVMVEIPRIVREFWIFDTGQNYLPLPAEVWQSLRIEYPEIEQKEVPCPNSDQIDTNA